MRSMDTLQAERLALMVQDVPMRPNNYDSAMDIRGTPVTVCPCDSQVWLLRVIFDHESGEIAYYFGDMECLLCGTIASAPMPTDTVEVEEYDG